MPTENIESFDSRPGIFLAHEMPENIKIAPLSDAAFRVLIEAWCYCSRVRSDGLIPDSVWRTMGTPKARRELTDPPKLAPTRTPPIRLIDGGVVCHDYLQHNRSAKEIEAVSGARSEGGTKGAHRRWHVGRRRYEADCEYCQEEGYVPKPDN